MQQKNEWMNKWEKNRKENRKNKNKMCEFVCVLEWFRKAEKRFWNDVEECTDVPFSFWPSPARSVAAITIIVIAWCRCHHCYRRLSVSMIFSTCVYWIVHNMGRHRHTTHMYTPPGHSPRNVWVFHTTFGHYYFNYVPCHAIPSHAEYFLRWKCWHTTTLFMYTESLSTMVAAMVLKSTHTLSAFSNNFAMCEEFFTMPPSHIHSLRWDRNQWNPAAAEETHTSHNRKVIFIVNDLNKQNVSVCVPNYPDRLFCASFLDYSNLSCAAM